MRIALFSDIHGNVTALDAVLADIDRRGGADLTIAAGDLIGGESGTDEILARLAERGALCVQGDNDTREKFLRLIAQAEAEPGSTRSTAAYYRETLAWIDANLSADGRAYLDALPLTRTIDTPAGRLFVCHASPRSNADRVCAPFCDVATLREAFAGVDADVVAYGHAHDAHVRFLDRRLWVNVAAVGFCVEAPARWTLLTAAEEHWQVAQYTTAYDVAAEQARGAAQNLPH